MQIDNQNRTPSDNGGDNGKNKLIDRFIIFGLGKTQYLFKSRENKKLGCYQLYNSAQMIANILERQKSQIE